MKRRLRVIIVFFTFFIIVYIISLKLGAQNDNLKTKSLKFSQENAILKPQTEMAIAVVVCGNRSEETLNMIKSALLFAKEHLHFYILTDDFASERIKPKLEEWQDIVNRSFSFEIRPVEFPDVRSPTEWRKLFKPCASQRLFLPGLLRETDSVLYVDTDTLFLGQVEQVWEHFLKMNQSQIAALAPEHEDPHIGWYNRFAKHPFYKPLGVNTGVMLMNLTRMRAFGWENYLAPIYKQYKSNIPWGDQDIINIIFSFHPDKLYIYGCHYNYRADHCMYSSACKIAEKDGVIVLHGSRGIFHNNKHPTFRTVYKVIQDYDWDDDLYRGFFLPLQKQLDDAPGSQCGAVKHALSRNLEKFVEKPVKV